MQATNAPNSSSGQFVDKTDLAPGTKWTAADANAWQAELLEVITEAGLTPNGSDLTQVRQAIQALAKLVKVDAALEADVLANPRTIGGVSFDGSANINLPGVNAAGNQDTSGNAATAGGIDFINGETGSIGTFELAPGGTYVLPKGTYIFASHNIISLQVLVGATWYGIVNSGISGLVVSDGSKFRLIHYSGSSNEIIGYSKIA